MSNLKDFIDELQELEEHYKNKVPEDYIERIRDIWCTAEDDIEEPVEEETCYSESYDYNRYLVEVR
jgi:hypothetical protein